MILATLSKTVEEDVLLTRELFVTILNARFDKINYNNAKQDVIPFIKDVESLNLRNKIIQK